MLSNTGQSGCFFSFSKNVFTISVYSFFLSFVIQSLQALLPVYMVDDLNFSMTNVGVISGVGLFLSIFPQLFSGELCDSFKIKKISLIFGCILSFIAIVSYPFVTSVYLMGLFYVLDKSGLGIIYPSIYSMVGQDSKKDDNVASSFGFRASLSYLGGAFGPLFVAYYLLDYQIKDILFLLYIPSFASLLIVLLFVSKDKIEQKVGLKKMLKDGVKNSIQDIKDFFSYDKNNKIYLMIGFFLFGIAKIGDAFIIIEGKNLGISIYLVSFIVVAINLGGVFLSFPLGKMADKIGSIKVLIFSSLLMCASQIIFVFNNQIDLFFVSCFVWGGAVGVSNAVLLSKVSKDYDDEKTGMSYSLCKISTIFAVFLSSILCGIIWDNLGSQFVFIYGLVVAVLFLIYNLFFIGKNKQIY